MQNNIRQVRFAAAAVLFVLALAGSASAQLVTENAGTASPETPHARFLIRAADWTHVTEYAAVANAWGLVGVTSASGHVVVKWPFEAFWNRDSLPFTVISRAIAA